jgi:PAS domain S-box-containing protein
MKTNGHKENRRLNIFIQVCGLLAVALGCSAILGWIFNIAQLASFEYNKIPMALSSAVLFVACGFIIFFHNRLPLSRIVSWVGIAFSSVEVLFALLLLYLSLNGIRPDAEHLGIKMNMVIDGLIVGHMSPITAFCFVLVGLSILIMLTKTVQKKQIKISLIFAAFVFLISIIFLLSYLFGAPLLYGGSLVPPALTTSIAFLFLGIALLLMSGIKVWSYEKLSEALNTRYTYILAFVFIVLIISIISAGYSYYKSYERQYRSEIENQLSAIAELKVSELVHWRKERLGDAEIFYRNPNFSLLIEKYFQNKNDLQSIKSIRIWMEHLLAAYQYDRLCLHDNKGNERFIFTNTPGPHSSKFNKHILEVIGSGKITFEDFYLNEYNNRIYLNISIPIFDTESNKKVIGIIAMRIDPEEYLYPLINKWPTPSKTAEILLIKRDGNDALYLNELRFKKNTTLNFRIPLTEKRIAAVQAVLGKKGIIEGVDYREVPVIAFVCPIPDSPWFLVARMDMSEVYAPLRERFWGIIILVAGFLIGSGASMGLVWWKQRSKFNKERYQSTENIRKLNRVYAVLSNINEAIVRIRKPQELFEKACDIAIDKGGFQMAWIGKINTQTKKVDMVASKGISESHFQKIDFYLNADENILEIAGQSIKNGAHLISNDILNDNILQPLHNNSVIFGYKSLGTFPLKVFGNVWGVFSLYSSESGFFDDEEIKLLDELAMDISFAIEFAEKETERKLAEGELRKLSRAVEQSPVRITITDLEGKVEYINPKFSEVTGYSLDEVKGKKLGILKSGYHTKEFYEKLWDTIHSGKDWTGEFYNKKKNGELFWEYGIISPIVNENGDITHFIGIEEDITEKKKMIEELTTAKELAEQSNKLKDAFIANMSHEIRTPLNGILGMTSLIRDTFHDNITEEDEELFTGIDFSCQRITRTVDMILTYSRLQIGEFPVSRKKLDLSSICVNLVREFNLAAKNKSLELTFQNNCGDATIFADEYSITMAISNLIDNAIKYTKKGFINVILYKGDDNEIILNVKDTGIGIDEGYLEKIFEPYSQEQMGYGRAYEGVGLGLSLVKKIVVVNNAKISVVSKKGEGSTFSINFGKAMQPVEKLAKTNEIVKVFPLPEKSLIKAVLIVEDDLINQLAIKRILENRYTTIITDSSDEVLEILKKNKVDIILMDISIWGKKNGLELTKELKASKEFSHIPIIAVTAHAFEDDRQNALEAGCDNFLTKPFSKKLLLDMMAGY